MSILNNSNFVLTRYLYIKDEVKIALVLCLLEKQREQSLFWAYELYYSGFREELFEFLWIIYFDFFALLNPSFEAYFLKKEKEWKQTSDAILVAVIVENLLIRPFNSNVFIVRHSIPDVKSELSKSCLSCHLNDYRPIAEFINETKEPLEQIYDKIISQFKLEDSQKEKKSKNFKSIIKNKQSMSRQILLSRAMILSTNKTKGRNLYIHVEPSEIVVYETCEDPEIKPYRMLNKVCLFGTNDLNHLHLFPLARSLVTDLKELYHNNWLFYASFSPIWLSRIQQYDGYCDYKEQKVIFKNEDQEESFYNKYNYEPDEQSIELKHKTIPELIEQPNVNILNLFQNINTGCNVIGMNIIKIETINVHLK